MKVDEANKLREELNQIEKEISEAKKDKEKQKQLSEKRSDKLKRFLDSFSAEEKKSWVEKELSNEGVIFSEFFGRYAKNEGLTTVQIRSIYGEVKRLQMRAEKIADILPNLRMLKPKLAYAAARANKEGTKELKNLLSLMLDSLTVNGISEEELKKRFENFANFFEAILAYHKAYGGN